MSDLNKEESVTKERHKRAAEFGGRQSWFSKFIYIKKEFAYFNPNFAIKISSFTWCLTALN